MKKTILTLSAVLTASALFLFGFTGGKLTLKEKIDQCQKIPVIILPNFVGITAISTTLGASRCNINKKTIETPKEYEEVLPVIINALNKGFGTSAFFIAEKYEEIPTKKTRILNAIVDMPDWANYKHKFIVHYELSINYDRQGSYETQDKTIKGNLNSSVSLNFYEIIGDKLGLVGSRIGYSLGSANSAKYPIDHCFSMSEFTTKEAPNSLAEPLKQSVETYFARFIEKVIKKYEKAMKKKK